MDCIGAPPMAMIECPLTSWCTQLIPLPIILLKVINIDHFVHLYKPFWIPIQFWPFPCPCIGLQYISEPAWSCCHLITCCKVTIHRGKGFHEKIMYNAGLEILSLSMTTNPVWCRIRILLHNKTSSFYPVSSRRNPSCEQAKPCKTNANYWVFRIMDYVQDHWSI